jgi:hypothetical protein
MNDLISLAGQNERYHDVHGSGNGTGQVGEFAPNAHVYLNGDGLGNGYGLTSGNGDGHGVDTALPCLIGDGAGYGVTRYTESYRPVTVYYGYDYGDGESRA